MQLSFTEKKNIRKSFGKLKESLSIPNLIEVQKNSYKELTEFNAEAAELTKGFDRVFKSIFPIEDLSSLTVAEAAELSKQLEEKWGVTPMAAAAPAAAGGAAPAEDKDDFTIMLVSAGDKKINVIKEVRAATSLGLKEAKDLVEGAPKEVKSGVNKKEAEEIKAKLEAAGAKVELK